MMNLSLLRFGAYVFKVEASLEISPMFPPPSPPKLLAVTFIFLGKNM